VVKLTPKGESAIQQKASIPLKFPQGIFRAQDRKEESRNAGGRDGGVHRATHPRRPQRLTQVARQRGLTLMTIYGHCAKLIEAGKVRRGPWSFEKNVQEKINAAIRNRSARPNISSPSKAVCPKRSRMR
jgi:hypothetical protein